MVSSSLRLVDKFLSPSRSFFPSLGALPILTLCSMPFLLVALLRSSNCPLSPGSPDFVYPPAHSSDFTFSPLPFCLRSVVFKRLLTPCGPPFPDLLLLLDLLLCTPFTSCYLFFSGTRVFVLEDKEFLQNSLMPH